MTWSRALFATVSLALVFFANNAHGQVSFSQPPTYADSTYTKPGQIFVADFNGDAKPDILAADKVDNRGTLDLGNGDGTFKSGTAVAGTPLAVADFNGDGKPDVLEQGTSALLVLLGNGNGTFQTPLSTNSNASLTAVATNDLNGDGKADVVGTFNTTLLVYVANGDGTFAAGVPYSLGVVQINSALIAFGDFNGDHQTDVAVLYGTQEIVLLGNGDGTFQPTPFASTAAPYNGSAVVVGDFNGDGKLDLVTFAGGGAAPGVSVFLQLGNGDGTFQASTTVLTAPASGVGAKMDTKT